MASTCRPATWAQVRARAVAIISSAVTLGLWRNRVIRISPARSPPSPRTLTPLPPCATSRSYKKAPLFQAFVPERPQRQLHPRLPSANHRHRCRESGQSTARKRQKMCECRRRRGGGLDGGELLLANVAELVE